MDAQTPDQFVTRLEEMDSEEVQNRFFALFQEALAIEENETSSQKTSKDTDTK